MTNVQKYTGIKSVDRPAFFSAIQKKDMAFIDRFIDEGYPLEEKNGAGNTALGFALVMNAPDIALHLIERGSSVHASAPNNTTVLMLAAQFKNFDVAAVMIARKADFRVRNTFGSSAKDILHEQGDAALPALAAMWAEMTPAEKKQEFSFCVRNGRLPGVRHFVEVEGMPVQSISTADRNEASSNGHADVIEYILKKEGRRAAQEVLQGTQREVQLMPRLKVKGMQP